MMPAAFASPDKSPPAGGSQLLGPSVIDRGAPPIPDALPVLPLRDTVAFPDMVIPLVVGRESSVKLIDEILVRDKMLALVTQKDPDQETPAPEDIHEIGIVGLVMKMFKFPDDTLRILVQGIERVKIGDVVQQTPYLVAKIDVQKTPSHKSNESRALRKEMDRAFTRLIDLVPGVPDEFKIAALNIEDSGKLADFIAAHLNLNLAEKQSVLTAIDPVSRMRYLVELLARELEVAEIGSRIQGRIKDKMDKGRREQLLREQLKAIQQELGEEEGKDVELAELREKVEQRGLSEEARKEADKELARLERMNPMSPEYSVALTYLQWLTGLPWQVSTQDTLDIESARTILDEDHWGLEKPKERILEFIAVRKLKPQGRSPILCFAGPPGVGKTSLGKSIARALGRKFARMSLGGVRDEAEIRGHRRTYVGALPGKIIQLINRAESNNPLIMLDEVDKLGSDFRGDPSSALLEVLDPEQNISFVDHYLGVAFDLSPVLFIVTANILDAVPPALRDRFETIQLPGYSEEEKVQIAKRYLLPEQIENHGLKKNQLRLEQNTLRRLIREYTREAGVRSLERELAAVCRKVTVKIAAKNSAANVTITAAELPNYLGPPKLYSEQAERVSGPGVAVGLAWTPTGGDIMFIESARMPGSGKLILTGQLGEVMQESVRTALSLLRSMSDRLGIDPEIYEREDLHLHFPEGAIPKDGPSAGGAVAACLVSLFTETPTRSDTAVTGEITLRGKILPVGGIKEKVLAAKRAGIKRVLLPERNRNDVQEIPESYLKDLEIIYVKTVDDVLAGAFEKRPGSAAGPKRKRKASAADKRKKTARGGRAALRR